MAVGGFCMINFNTVADLISMAEEGNRSIAQIILQRETERTLQSAEKIREAMFRNWIVMEEAIYKGLNSQEKSVSGLTGGDAVKLQAHLDKSYLGADALMGAAAAVAISEVNACMGRIVACPTAGSCGILPAALYAAVCKYEYDKESIIDAMLTASGIGMVVEQNASIAGAYGGCQAECGTAAGMAAAALVQLAGGTPEQIGQAVALAIKNLLGLACDPVAGLVEVPCVKRNGFEAVHAMLAADMAMAGVKSVIPVDEVIEAMNQIGRMMPTSLKETSEAGLAVTKTGKALTAKIFAV